MDNLVANDNNLTRQTVIICTICIVIIIAIALLVWSLFVRMADDNYNASTAENYTAILMDRDIKLYYIDNFLSDNECDHLIESARDRFTRSGIVIGEKTGYGDARTSNTYHFGKSQDSIIKNIENRVSAATNKSIECLESLQIVKYDSGQQFKEHHDWFQKDYMEMNGNQRQYTFFVYLNDVNNGGYTRFPRLNLAFKPKKGSALFWQNCATPDMCFEKNLHQGEPPIGEIKYGLNIWINFDPIK